MIQRVPFAELEWRGKPVADLGRSELLDLGEVLHGMVCESAENFQRVHAFNTELIERNGGRA